MSTYRVELFYHENEVTWGRKNIKNRKERERIEEIEICIDLICNYIRELSDLFIY